MDKKKVPEKDQSQWLKEYMYDMNLSTANWTKKQYDSMQDPNLTDYFNNPVVRKQLQKIGIVSNEDLFEIKWTAI